MLLIRIQTVSTFFTFHFLINGASTTAAGIRMTYWKALCNRIMNFFFLFTLQVIIEKKEKDKKKTESRKAHQSIVFEKGNPIKS